MEHLNSWVASAANHDFSIYNLPFGIFSTDDKKKVGIAIGDQIVDLSALDLGIDAHVLKNDFLNDFISLGKEKTNAVRLKVQEMLLEGNENDQIKAALIAASDAQMHMPVKVGDYTDFYSSIEHATNVGKMFRDPENALLPNWRHIPVGYHGRASSIVPSGTPIKRPKGQVMPKDADAPVYKACALLDMELEMAFIVGKSTDMGNRVSTADAEDHIFGMVLFNDWSARDIQKWEYVPLGPFLGKSFASSVSPWVVTLEALKPFAVQGPKQEPEVLPYLKCEGMGNYNVNLSVELTPPNGEAEVICQSNYQYMYWNMKQQLAHHTVNGCNLNVGDMMASGTISGKDENSYGSMLEISWAGSKPLTLKDGSERKFFLDGDQVTIKGHAEKDGVRVGFGEVTGVITPAE